MNRSLRSPRRSAPSAWAARIFRPSFLPRVELLEDRLAPATLTVNTIQDVLNPADGTLSLRGAIAAINVGSSSGLTPGAQGQVVLGPGYGINDTILFNLPNSSAITLGSALPTLARSMSILGPGAAALSLDGNDLYQILNVGTGITATVSGLTFVDGFISGNGGAILNNGTLTVNNCAFLDNEAEANGTPLTGNGGAIFNNATLTVNNSTFSNNDAVLAGPGDISHGNGGAIFSNVISAGVGSVLTVSGSSFTGNTSTRSGGAINAYWPGQTGWMACDLDIINSTFTSNTAGDNGGGIRAFANLNLVLSTFTGNSAFDGGGLSLTGTPATALVSYCTFSGNTAVQSGGGVNVFLTTSLTVANCAIIGNHVSNTSGAGGGIFVNTSATLTNNTIANNTMGVNGFGTAINGNGGTLNVRNSTVVGSIYFTNVGNGFLYNSIVQTSSIFGLASQGYNLVAPGDFFTPHANDLVTPRVTTFAAFATGGTLSAGAYSYRISAVTGAGTFTSPVYSFNPSGASNTQQIRVRWNAIPGATSYNIYGRTAGNEQLIGSVSGGTTEFFDTGAVVPSGMPVEAMLPPALNGGPTQTMALPPGSVAINTGDPGFVEPPFVDQRGFDRTIGRVDIGGFEANSTAISPLTVNPATLPPTNTGAAYNQTLTASGGTASYLFALTSGSLPPGINLSANGVLAGSATATGTFNFTVTGIDSAGNIGTRGYSLAVNGALGFIPATLPVGTVNNPYSQVLTPGGGSPGYTFSQTGTLPPGITFNTGTGTFSGTPTSAGTFSNIQVTLTDSTTATFMRTYTLVVNPAVTIAPPMLPDATISTTYSQTFTAGGGSGTGYTFLLTGTLPTGLGFNPGTATLSGTPTQAGSFSIQVQATDSVGGFATQPYTLNVIAPLAFTPTTLPVATENNAYSEALNPTGGSGSGYVFSQTGTLPTGITFDVGTGTFLGTPTQSGTFSNIQVTLTDSAADSVMQTYTLVVNPAVVVAPPTIPVGMVGAPYSQTFTASGGSGTGYTFILSGALPTGLSFTSGTLSGTPTQSGTFNIQVQATDSIGGTATQPYTLTVNPALAIAPTTLPVGTVNNVYAQPLTPSGGSGVGYVFSQTGALPTGLTFSAGTFSGTPTQSGTFTNIQVTLTDSAGFSTVRTYSLTINPAVTVNPAALPTATVNNAYSQALAAGGGSGSGYTFSFIGTLPTGVTFNTGTGTFSGTPTQSGTFNNLQVTVTDSIGATGNRVYSLTVNPAIAVNPASLPNALAGTPYSQALTASGGSGTGYTFAVTSGALPAWLSLSGGVLAGTPAATDFGSSAFTITATDSLGATGARAYTLTVNATHLTFLVQPAETRVGDVMTPVTVQLLDANNMPITTGPQSTANITLALGSNPGGGVLGGTLTRAAVNGVATFNDLTISRVGIGYTLTATSPGLAPTTSMPFNVVSLGIGVYDPGSAQWYLRDSLTPGAPFVTPFAYGFGGVIPVTGDWDGDGIKTIGVYDPRTAMWYLRNSNSPGAPSFTPFAYGFGGVVPVVGDWDGNGTDTIGVYDPRTATWYLRNSVSPGAPDIIPFAYGFGDKPVVGDWDGNGSDTVGIYGVGNATWYLRNSNSAGVPNINPFAYGWAPSSYASRTGPVFVPGSTPVVGDWDLSGNTTIGVYDPRAATWYLRNSNTPGAPNITPFAYGFGNAPLVGDWRFPGAPLLASVTGTGADGLSAADLAAAGAGALQRLQLAGADAALLARLRSVRLEIGWLDGAYLGRTFVHEGRIVIDADAAGHGWFVDAAPLDDVEFATGGATGRIDLLSAVLHELGHAAGLEHDHGFMAAVLAPGTRNLDGLDAFFATH